MMDFDPAAHPRGELKTAEEDFIQRQLEVLHMRSLAMRTNLLHHSAIKELSFDAQQRVMDQVTNRLDRTKTMEDRFRLFFEPGIGNIIGSADLSFVSHPATRSDFESQRDQFRELRDKYGIIGFARENEGKPEWSCMEVRDVDGEQMAVLVRARTVGAVVKPDRTVNVDKRSILLARNIEKFGRMKTPEMPRIEMNGHQVMFPTPIISPRYVFDEAKLQRDVDNGYTADLVPVQVSLFAHVNYHDFSQDK